MFTPSDVQIGRVHSQLDTLAQIGRQPSGGVTRYTFSPDHLQVTHLTAAWMSAAGLDVLFDRWGNLVGHSPGVGPMVMSGSHLDSVPNGGHYDGVLGVIAALEAVTLILEQGLPVRKPLAVVSFIEEEGARFHGLLGSTLAVGQLNDAEIDAIRDGQGVGFRDALADSSFGYPLTDFDFRSDSDSFLELHIEQGKRLERAGIPIGIVTSIAGPTFMQVTFTGQADHAGATEYEDRHDTLLAAAEFIVALRELGTSRFAGRGHMTVGKIAARPNVTNVVAGETIFSVDYRAADVQTAAEMAEAIDELLAVTAARQRVTWHAEIGHQTPPTPARDRIRSAVETGADRAGAAHQPVVSWAAHDTMNMASVCDAGMIFVPCRDGRSHTPEEYVRPEDIATGIAVLANALLMLAQ
ncbi:MAG: Zn-dependent hydrolase [Anaerolineae bacterium]|nr:Zn-dependent hydrolase [Anaerolineae bacterium]